MKSTASFKWLLVLVCFSITVNTIDSVPASACSVNGQLDIIFIIDSSLDLAADPYQRVSDFILTVISGIDISENGARVAVIPSFNDSSFFLNLTSNKGIIFQHLHKIPSNVRAVDFIDAAFEASDMFIREGRPDAKRVVVAVRSAEAAGADDENLPRVVFVELLASFLVVGVEPGSDQVNVKSSSPEAKYLISLSDIQSLIASGTLIGRKVCEATHCTFDIEADVMFAISTTQDNYRKAGQLAWEISKSFNITVGGTYVGLANTNPDYSSQPMWIKNWVKNLLEDVPEPYNVQSPLEKAVEMILFPYSGRRNGIKVIVFITDHQSFKPQQDLSSAELAKSRGYVVFTVALTSDVEQNVLRSMASKTEYNLPLDDHSVLTNFVAQSGKRGTCET